MFRSTTLACSFCGRDESQVAKLVADPKVYICDACVAEASRIMSATGSDDLRHGCDGGRATLLERLNRWLGRMQCALGLRTAGAP